MTTKMIISNWKLNGSMTLLETLLKPLDDFFHKYKISINLIVTPPYVYLYPSKKILSHTRISLGAQNVDINLTGAFTGEISINMLKDIGVKYVIVGHSERRLHHQENDKIIAKKFKIVKDANLIPILCIGETQYDYINKQTKLVCQNQLNSIFELLDKNGINNSIIAYEPRWAIGSKNIPSITFIRDILDFIKNYVFKKQNNNIKLFSIQYGGAINEHNIEKLCNEKNIDGFLIGSASLSINGFLKIIKKISKYN